MINCIKKLHCKTFLHIYLKLIHLTPAFKVEINQKVREKLNIFPLKLKIMSLFGKKSNILTRFGTNFAYLVLRLKQLGYEYE